MLDRRAWPCRPRARSSGTSSSRSHGAPRCSPPLSDRSRCSIKTAQSGFESVDRRLEQAAQTLGHSELSIFWTISVPLAWRAILAGTVLAFCRAFGDFGITLMVAGDIPGRTQTLPLAIYDHVQAYQLDQANLLSLMSIGIVIPAHARVRPRSPLALLMLSVRGRKRFGDFTLNAVWTSDLPVIALVGPLRLRQDTDAAVHCRAHCTRRRANRVGRPRAVRPKPGNQSPAAATRRSGTSSRGMRFSRI